MTITINKKNTTIAKLIPIASIIKIGNEGKS